MVQKSTNTRPVIDEPGTPFAPASQGPTVSQDPTAVAVSLRRLRLPHLASGIITGAAVLFFCFHRLGVNSLGKGDETLYALATQGTAHSEHWWLPMWNSKPYFMTAPLKLWLNMLVIHVLGESNVSYRLIDALSGCGTFLLLYLFALDLFHDRRVSILSVFTLLGCNSYIHLHGPRQGVLDSLLLFFTTLTIYAGWRILSRLERYGSTANARAYDAGIGWAVLSGIGLGLGFMTKSAGSDRRS